MNTRILDPRNPNNEQALFDVAHGTEATSFGIHRLVVVVGVVPSAAGGVLDGAVVINRLVIRVYRAKSFDRDDK